MIAIFKFIWICLAIFGGFYLAYQIGFSLYWRIKDRDAN